LWIK